MSGLAAAAQLSYHRRLYEALWDTGVAASAAEGASLSNLDQMGHFGSAGGDLIAATLTTTLAGRRVACLELGCGFGGAMRYVLGKLGAGIEVRLAVGIDIVAEHCRVMRGMNAAVAPARRAYPVCTSVSGIGLRSETFDAVFATGSASHFPDMGAVLAQSYRVLRPGGVLTFIEEVSLVKGTPSARFRQFHPADVFAVSSWPQRQAQLRACGFDAIEWTDLSGWAATQLKQRLLAMRIYRKKLDECYGASRSQEIFDTLNAAQSEFAAGTVMPVHVTAHRPMR